MRSLFYILLLSMLFHNAFAADQVDFPNIYIDADAGDGGVGSQADPYNDLSDINQTTGGDNSIYDYINGSPSEDVVIHLQKGDEWRANFPTIVVSGTSQYKIRLTSYGDGDLPVINGSNAITGWSVYSGNVWRASFAADPDSVFFTESGPTYTWGDRQGSIGGCTAKYDVYYSGGYMYTYSTTDPDSAYTSIDGSLRTEQIHFNGHDYWVVDGIELRFVGAGGADNDAVVLDGGLCQDIEIKNCYIHHIGHREATERGNAILVKDSANAWIHNNHVAESGRHLIYLYAGSGDDCTNAIVEKNYFHNGYHTQFDLNQAPGDSHSGHVIRYNHIHFDGVDLDGQAGGSFINGNGSAISNIYIYGNVFTGDLKPIINIYGDVSNLYFYNNSGYQTYDDSGMYGMIIETTGISGIRAANNSFYITSSSSAAGCFNINTDSVFASLDYNVCYVPNGYYGYDGSFRTFSAWKSAHSGLSVNSYNDNPDYTDPDSDDLTLQDGAPGLNSGDDLGATYDDALDPDSSWPDNVILSKQGENGIGWEIGAYVYEVGQLNISITIGSGNMGATIGSGPFTLGFE